MKVLLAGGSGLLGSVLSRQLQQVGHNVVVHSNVSPGEFRCDLTSERLTRDFVGKIRPDCIINLVALTNVDACENSLHSAYLLNVKVVENIAYAIGNSDIHLIQLSTDHVYDREGVNAEGHIRLTNCYALTKYAGEIAAALVKGTVLRTNFFGPSFLSTRDSYSDWILNNLNNRVKFSVFSDVIFNPLSMSTLSKLIALIVENPSPGVFNLGSRHPMSKADFAFQLAKLSGLDTEGLMRCSVDEMRLKAYRPKSMAMDCTSFEKRFKLTLPSLIDEIGSIFRSVQ
jgi:dTDP-4-dehydrorhamnose reductase